jgi:predicted nucleic acid-binding protein
MITDTSIVLGYLNQTIPSPQIPRIEFLLLYELQVSVVTRIELLGFPGISERQTKEIQDILNDGTVHLLSEEIEISAINIRRYTRLKLGDAIIAATALATNQSLLIADQRGFQQVPGLKLLRPAELV